MQKTFPGFYRTTDEDLKEIWSKAIFILDTNILLGFYRYPKETYQELMGTFNQVAKSLWIPHQVALEFQENRLSVISEQKSKFDEIIKIINNTKITMEQKIDGLQLKKRHSVIDPTEFQENITRIFTEFEGELQKLKMSQPDVFDNDVIRSDIDRLFQDKVGSPLTSEELKSLYSEGKDRYEQHRPPGYLDQGKSKEEEKYYFAGDLSIQREFGDLIIWYQIIKETTKNNFEHIILITDDEKDDWWWTYNGKKIGPRPELVEEIIQKSNAKSFFMYNSVRFLKYAKDLLGAEIKQETINQIQQISEFNKKSNSGFLVTQHKNEEVERIVYKWLQSRFFENFEVIQNNGFPDFLILRDNEKFGVEVKYLRELRNLFHRGRDFAYRAFYEMSLSDFDAFYLAFVFNHDENSHFDRWIKNFEIPNGVSILLFEVFFDSEGNAVDLHLIKEISGNNKGG